MNIGSKIKSVREAKKMTQEELGIACGTTKQTIFKYETGVVTNIPLDRVEKIADVLGVSPAYLLGWEQPSDLFAEKPPILSVKDERNDVNLIKIAGRDGSYTEKRVSDEQLALFQSMLDQMKPVDDEV